MRVSFWAVALADIRSVLPLHGSSNLQRSRRWRKFGHQHNLIWDHCWIKMDANLPRTIIIQGKHESEWSFLSEVNRLELCMTLVPLEDIYYQKSKTILKVYKYVIYLLLWASFAHRRSCCHPLQAVWLIILDFAGKAGLFNGFTLCFLHIILCEFLFCSFPKTICSHNPPELQWLQLGTMYTVAVAPLRSFICLTWKKMSNWRILAAQTL